MNEQWNFTRYLRKASYRKQWSPKETENKNYKETETMQKTEENFKMITTLREIKDIVHIK